MACLLLVIVAVQAPSAFAATGFPTTRLIRYATGTPLDTFDPHRANTGPAFSSYLTLVYDGLTQIDPNNLGQVEPALATGWRWLDSKTLEFRLRRGVRFSDGRPFNGSAAEANIERMLALKGPRIETVASIASVESPSPFRLILHLHNPDPTLLYNLALAPGMMISPAAFNNKDLDLNPVGTGPWIFDKSRSTIGDVYYFRLNPHYWGGQPKGRADIEVFVMTDPRARLNALLSNQIDLTSLGPAEADYARRRGIAIASRRNRWLGMTILDRTGRLVPQFADRRVRLALNYAVDRRALAKVVFFGYAKAACQPMIALGHVKALEHFCAYDPDKSRQLLRAAHATGFSFSVPIVASTIAPYEAIQYYLRQVGINMQIKVIDPGSIAAIARTREFAVNTIGYPNFDPDSRHLAIWGTNAAFNPFHDSSPRLDRLAAEARGSVNQLKRVSLYDKYFNIVVKDVHSVVYLQLDDLVGYNASRVDNVKVSRYIDPLLRQVRLKSARKGASR